MGRVLAVRVPPLVDGPLGLGLDGRREVGGQRELVPDPGEADPIAVRAYDHGGHISPLVFVPLSVRLVPGFGTGLGDLQSARGGLLVGVGTEPVDGWADLAVLDPVVLGAVVPTGVRVVVDHGLSVRLRTVEWRDEQGGFAVGGGLRPPESSVCGVLFGDITVTCGLGFKVST